MIGPHRFLPLLALIIVIVALWVATPDATSATNCRIRPGATLALVQIVRDTTLPLSRIRMEPMSFSSVGKGPHDTLLATPDTPMPAARVRLIELDTATRRLLAKAGITDSQPSAFMLAAPYRADCRTIRWTGAEWTAAGDTGYVRARVTEREQWISGKPLLIILDAWNYPYPRQRGLAYPAGLSEKLTSAKPFYELAATLDGLGVEAERPGGGSDSITHALVDWARRNAAEAELEPARTLVRRMILASDRRAVERAPSRLRGTYRLRLESGAARGEAFLRLLDRPSGPWRTADSLRSTADVLAMPHQSGYVLAGAAAASLDSLPSVYEMRGSSFMRTWLFVEDAPTRSDNLARRQLTARLDVLLNVVPSMSEQVLAILPPMTALESTFVARRPPGMPPFERWAEFPVTLHLVGGAVRGDTTLTRNGNALRVKLERIDTTSIKRP